MENKFVEKITKDIHDYIKEAEKLKYLPIENTLDDVYDVPSKRLERQQKMLNDHYKKYETEYSLTKYEKINN